MQLRLKIFLSTGALFCATVTSLFILGDVEIKSHLKKAENDLKKEIIKLDDQHLADILTYLQLQTAGIKIHLSSLFRKISELEWLKIKYAPSIFNFQTLDWESSSILMMTNEWIDLVQTVADKKLTSLILSKPPFLERFFHLDIDSIAIIVQKDDDNRLIPYIGVPYWSDKYSEHVPASGPSVITSSDRNNSTWILFTAEQMKNLDLTKLKPQNSTLRNSSLEPTIAIHSDNVFQDLTRETIENITKVHNELLAHPTLLKMLSSPEESANWITAQLKEQKIDPNTLPTNCTGPLCETAETHLVSSALNRIESLGDRYDQTRLIWEISTLTAAGIWDFEPLQDNAPKGIVSFPPRIQGSQVNALGYGLLCNQVFYPTPFPIDLSCNPLKPKPGEVNTCFSGELELFAGESYNALYLGSSMVFSDATAPNMPPTMGTLTLAVAIDPILQELALIIPDTVMFVTNAGRILTFTKNGVVEEAHDWVDLNSKQLIEQKTGTIQKRNGQEYYFIHLTQFAPTYNDAHVFLIQLKESRFTMIQLLNKGADHLLESIFSESLLLSLIALVIVLFILNRILKHTTTPLHRLATATRAIGRGDLDQVSIPPMTPGQSDEVNLLCSVFSETLESLKEGREVRGLLDKVVSKEIATKILAEGIQLGGELRPVTVLFADIRSFTHITEHMPPQDVLTMLNECLNLLSQAVDDYKGIIDKYVGDEIMALFGVPVASETPALQAVLCALEMQESLELWNEQRKVRGQLPLHIGIGIDTGTVIAGNIGSQNRRSYTVLGHHVNVAARLTDLAGPNDIIITESTLRAPYVEAALKCELLPPTALPGLTTPIPLYKIKRKV